jgi:outer membrane protein
MSAQMKAGIVAPVLILLTGMSPALAEDDGFGGFLALGGAAVPDYEGSEDYMPVPLIVGKLSYDDYYIEARGPNVRANILPGDLLPFGLEFGPSLSYRGGRSDVDNDRIDDLRNIDGTVEAGAFAKLYTNAVLHPSDEIAFEVEFLSDIGNEHDGTLINFGPSYSFSPWESWRLGISGSATYASGNYNETFFSVDANNAARSGLSQYDADAGIKDVGVMVNASYQWNEHWGVTGMAGITQLVGDAADSPIVDDEGSATQGIVGAGLVFRF